MICRRHVLALMILTSGTAGAQAPNATRAQAGPKLPTIRTDLQRHDISIDGWETLQSRIDFEPGTFAPMHRHPGEEVIYVLGGTLEYQIKGKPPVTLEAGDVLFVPTETFHSARNVGTGKGSELATYIVEKGKPLLVLEK